MLFSVPCRDRGFQNEGLMMRGNSLKLALLAAALGLVAGCEEVVPPEPEQPAAVIVQPVITQPVVVAPVVKKKPVIDFDDDRGGGGGGGWR
jgi:hypothetical protein